MKEFTVCYCPVCSVQFGSTMDWVFGACPLQQLIHLGRLTTNSRQVHPRDGWWSRARYRPRWLREDHGRSSCNSTVVRNKPFRYWQWVVLVSPNQHRNPTLEICLLHAQWSDFWSATSDTRVAETGVHGWRKCESLLSPSEALQLVTIQLYACSRIMCSQAETAISNRMAGLLMGAGGSPFTSGDCCPSVVVGHHLTS